jgi:hypothetical protein
MRSTTRSITTTTKIPTNGSNRGRPSVRFGFGFAILLLPVCEYGRSPSTVVGEGLYRDLDLLS